MEYEKISEEEHRRIRFAAFASVVISTVAVAAAVVALPMLYTYVQGLQSHMLNEINYCRVRFLIF